MKQPAYHLRPNKAVDRFILLEVIRRLGRIENLADYTYYSLGGAYLEDFRVLYEFSQDISLVSIEEKEHIVKRQEFHRPCSTLQLKHVNLVDFLNDCEYRDQKSIFWLDFTNLTFSNFERFEFLLRNVAERSLVKISLRAHATDWSTHPKDFVEEFRRIMPDPNSEPPLLIPRYTKLIQDMLQIVAQRALSSECPVTFQPITSFFYSDFSGMLTLTGIVRSRQEEDKFRSEFEGWQFANLDWSEPKVIDVPLLSTKERLFLQEKLPCKEDAGKALFDALGYELEEKKGRTKLQFEQYAEFHRYYPYFIRAAP